MATPNWYMKVILPNMTVASGQICNNIPIKQYQLFIQSGVLAAKFGETKAAKGKTGITQCHHFPRLFVQAFCVGFDGKQGFILCDIIGTCNKYANLWISN